MEGKWAPSILVTIVFFKSPGNITETLDEKQNHKLSLLAEQLKQLIRKEFT